MGSKTVPMGSNLQCLPDSVRPPLKISKIIAGNVFLTFIFLHFAPIWSVVKNPHCHFSMDEPIGSFSPVQGEFILGLIPVYTSHVVESSRVKSSVLDIYKFIIRPGFF